MNHANIEKYFLDIMMAILALPHDEDRLLAMYELQSEMSRIASTILAELDAFDVGPSAKVQARAFLRELVLVADRNVNQLAEKIRERSN